MKKNYFKNLMQVSLLLGAAFVISSCDDVIGQEDNPVASYVQWQAKTPEEVTLKIGNTYTVKATAVSSAIIVYESENPEIAKVDPVTGVITAVAVGETNINAVVTGISTTGQSVFTPEKVSIKVIVKDGKASLTRTVDEVIEFTANKNSIIDLSKLFTAYPKVGTGDNESAISFKAFSYVYNASTKKYDKTDYNTTALGTLSSDDKQFKIGGSLGLAIGPKDISDTLYVVATINPAVPAKNEYDYTTKADATKDTVKIVLKKSIAYMNAEGKREILTADKYKELKLDGTAIEAGTYYVNDVAASITTATDINGDVTLIFADTKNATLQNLDDKTDNAKLNIFGEAKQKGTEERVYEAWNPTITITGATVNAITNFKEINIYTGTFTVSKAITAVKDINVYGGALTVDAKAAYAMKLTGTLTINGGTVTAKGYGSDTENGFAVIGNVVLNKGAFEASNADYRAVNGTLTAGTGFEFLAGATADKGKATAIEGTTSNSKYIWGQAVPKK